MQLHFQNLPKASGDRFWRFRFRMGGYLRSERDTNDDLLTRISFCATLSAEIRFASTSQGTIDTRPLEGGFSIRSESYHKTGGRFEYSSRLPLCPPVAGKAARVGRIFTAWLNVGQRQGDKVRRRASTRSSSTEYAVSKRRRFLSVISIVFRPDSTGG